MSLVHRLLCILFVAATGAVYLVGSSPLGARGGEYIALHFALTAVMLGVWAVPEAATDHRWTLVAGVVARLLLIRSAAFTSHDALRYLWDGNAVLAGVDPYRSTPEAARHLVGGWPLPPDNTGYPTLYPPGALGLFAASAAFGPGLAFWIWKAIVAAASCAALVFVWRVMKARSRERHLPLAALSPLLVLEGGVGAHVDIVASLGIAAAVFFEDRGRLGSAGASIGAAAVTKILPITLLVPAAAASRRCAPAIIGLAVIITIYTTMLLRGLQPIGSLPAFFRERRFGSPLFELAAGVVGDARARQLMPVVAALGFALTAARARKDGFVPGAKWALAVPLLASPVVFPWYLAPFVLPLALCPSAAGIAWVSVLPLTYEVIDGSDRIGVWQPASWPLWAIAAAWVAGIAVDSIRGRRARLQDRGADSAGGAPVLRSTASGTR